MNRAALIIIAVALAATVAVITTTGPMTTPSVITLPASVATLAAIIVVVIQQRKVHAELTKVNYFTRRSGQMALVTLVAYADDFGPTVRLEPPLRDCLRPTLFWFYYQYPEFDWHDQPWTPPELDCEHTAPLHVVDLIERFLPLAAEIGPEHAHAQLPQWTAVCHRCAHRFLSNDPGVPADVRERVTADVHRQRTNDPHNHAYRLAHLQEGIEAKIREDDA